MKIGAWPRHVDWMHSKGGGVLQNQYHRDIDKLSRTCVYTVNRNKSLYHIHGLYVIDNMNLVK